MVWRKAFCLVAGRDAILLSLRRIFRLGFFAPTLFSPFSPRISSAETLGLLLHRGLCEQCPSLAGLLPHREGALRAAQKRAPSFLALREGYRGESDGEERGGEEGQSAHLPPRDLNSHAAQPRGPPPHPRDPGVHELTDHAGLHAREHRGPQGGSEALHPHGKRAGVETLKPRVVSNEVSARASKQGEKEDLIEFPRSRILPWSTGR